MAKKESDTSIVDKGWNIISHNTELLFFIALGFIEVLAEAAGYRPFLRLNDLLPPLPEHEEGSETNTTLPNNTTQVEPTDFPLIYQISRGIDLAGSYTVHLSLACHLLLPYPVITERQKVLLVPWLVVNLVRSVLRELVISLVGIVLCASRDVFSYPCAQYSALQGAQFCFILYFWTSMHSFYHFLNSSQSTERRVTSVLKSIKRTSTFLDSSPLVEESVDRVLSVVLEEDDDHTEVTLVERAAMAWIAREILENNQDYITDKQFSQYLVVKATMELRQALKELAERSKKNKKKKLSPKQRLEESLEYMRLSREERKGSLPKVEAFDSCMGLSRRDPIRKIRPLTTLGKPVSSEMSMITGMSGLSDITAASDTSVDSEVQTEPSTKKMSKLLDMLDYQQQRFSRTDEPQ